MSVTFLNALPAPLGHVLHIGAGQGGDLSAYLDAGAQAVTLVEPDPEALVDLRQVARADPRVTVVGAAICVDQNATGLHRFNFPDLNSLRPAEALGALFPGLEELGCEPVPLRTPEDLVSMLEMPAGQAHVLVIEAPGEAMSILQALAKAELLQQFSGVSIQGSAKARYRGEDPIGKIASWLRSVGFPDAQENAFEDPDFPHINVVRNVQAEALAALEEERDKARARAEAQKQRAVEARREKGQIQASLTREKKRTSELEEELAAAQARIAALEPLEARVGEVRASRDTAQQKLAELRTALREEQTRKATAVERLSGTEMRAAELEKRVAELEAEQTRLKEQLATARQAAQEYETQAAHVAVSREEILRAEGQIDLIKDLLLRGPDL